MFYHMLLRLFNGLNIAQPISINLYHNAFNIRPYILNGILVNKLKYIPANTQLRGQYSNI